MHCGWDTIIIIKKTSGSPSGGSQITRDLLHIVEHVCDTRSICVADLRPILEELQPRFQIASIIGELRLSPSAGDNHKCGLNQRFSTVMVMVDVWFITEPALFRRIVVIPAPKMECRLVLRHGTVIQGSKTTHKNPVGPG